MAKAKDGVLESFGERWNKKAKSDIVTSASDTRLDQPPIPTGLELVDNVLGGGFMRGRITMLYGAEMAGKTLLSQIVIGNVQRAGGRALFVDAERAFTPSWFELTGVDLSPDKLQVVRPRSMEQCFDLVCDALEEEVADVLVVDSLPALVPNAVMAAELDEKDFKGLDARKMTQGVKKATQFNRSTALIVINQMRVNMNATAWENPETYPGGRALRHHCSVVVRVRRGSWLTAASERGEIIARGEKADRKDIQRIGYTMRIRTEKNKLAPPFQETDVKVYFTGVIDDVNAMIDTLLQRQVIAGSVGYYTVPGIKEKVHGRLALEELIKGDDALRTRLFEQVKVA